MKENAPLQGNFSSEQQKAVVNIRVTANHIGAQYAKFMACYDLSMAQFNILRILRGAKEPVTITTVKERMIEKSPNTTRLIDKLLDKTLVKKFQCKEDRRQTYLHITSAGLDLLSDIDQRSDLNALIPSALSQEEASHLNSLLDKVRESI